MLQRRSDERVAAMVLKASWPALPTLLRLYRTAKGVYSSCVPTAAANMLQSVATKLLTAGTPHCPSDLPHVDLLVAECLASVSLLASYHHPGKVCDESHNIFQIS